MKLLGLLALVLALMSTGCAGDGQWDEFKKDLRGDNMQMRSGRSSMSSALDSSAR